MLVLPPPIIITSSSSSSLVAAVENHDRDQIWTFDKLVESIGSMPHKVEWAEQGLLNAIFKDAFHEMPYIYNANLLSKMDEPDLWRRYRNHITIVHYTVAKGWMSFRHFELVSTFVLHDEMSKAWKYFSCWKHDVDDFCQLWDRV